MKVDSGYVTLTGEPMVVHLTESATDVLDALDETFNDLLKDYYMISRTHDRTGANCIIAVMAACLANPEWAQAVLIQAGCVPELWASVGQHIVGAVPVSSR